jgi:hypothetical protein
VAAAPFVKAYQEERTMPFVTTPERYGRKLGMLLCVERGLHLKFGEAGVALLPEIKALSDPEKILAVYDAIVMATSLDEVRRACAKAAPPLLAARGRRARTASAPARRGTWPTHWSVGRRR